MVRKTVETEDRVRVTGMEKMMINRAAVHGLTVERSEGRRYNRRLLNLLKGEEPLRTDLTVEEVGLILDGYEIGSKMESI